VDIHELKHQAENKPPVLVFNPLLKDFRTKFVNYNEVILKGNEITSVDGNIADRVLTQLVTFIMNEREIDPMSLDVAKIKKEIEVIL
jgi:hypothetical protein